MNSLIKCLTSDEEIQIENTLKELYALQGLRPDKESFATMLSELLSCGKPFKAIITGLYSLKSVELRRISYPSLINAIMDKVDETPQELVQCDDCYDGRNSFQDSEGRWWARACHCQNGEVWVRRGLKRMVKGDTGF